MPKIAYPSFRRSEPKMTKPRTMRDEAGWFTYVCTRCGGTARYRRRQRHPERARCMVCRVKTVT
jgi:predicted SprT family Zn-dependent metalloprotease